MIDKKNYVEVHIDDVYKMLGTREYNKAENRGQFLAKTAYNTRVVVDNRTGDFFMEEYKTKGNAVKRLKKF